MKLVSKKFIKELSKIVDCNICFQCMKEPIECAQCQNIWCRDCIVRNEGKCPNKCINTHFAKPHRLFRQILNEVLIECDKCQNRVKQIEYDTHIKSKQCLAIQNKKSKINRPIQSNEPLRKILKREEKQKSTFFSQKQQQQEDYQDTDDSISGMMNTHINNDQEQVNSSQTTKNNESITDCDLSSIFSDDSSSSTTTNQPQVNIKKEKFKKGININEFQTHFDISPNNFKAMQISIFSEGAWSTLDEESNTQLNFEVLRYMSENDDLQEMCIQIKNTVYDFSKFEAYEIFESLRVLDNEEYDYEDRKYYSVGIEKKRMIGKFRIFNNTQEFIQNVKVYFLCEGDSIYYQNQDQENILLSYFTSPTSTHIKTARSNVNLETLKEDNKKSIRDIRFQIAF